VVTDPKGMALFIVVVVILWGLIMTFILPKVTPYSRKQCALFLAALLVLWIPMGYYLIFVVGTSKNIDPRHVARVGGLNLLICVPLLILIGRRIFKVTK